MSILTRATIFAFLTIALGQFPLPERVGPVDDRATPEAEVVRVPNVPHPATSGVRTCLLDALAPGFTGTTFAAPASGTEPDDECVTVLTSTHAHVGSGFDAAVLLPPSRAPPAHS